MRRAMAVAARVARSCADDAADRHGGGSGPRAAGLLVGVVVRAYHPLQIRSAAREQFWARMWAYELGPARASSGSPPPPNTMIRDVAGDRRLRPRVHAPVGRSCAASSTRPRRAACGVARTGDMISYETSHPVVLQADQPFESLVVRGSRASCCGRRGGADHQPDRGEDLRAATALPRQPRRVPARAGRRLEHGTITAEDAPDGRGRVLDLIREPLRRPDVRGRADELGRAQRSCSTSSRSSRRTSATRASTPRRSPGRASSRRGTCTSCSRRRARACAAGSAPRGSSAAAETWSIRRSTTRRSSRSRVAGDCRAPQHFSRLFRSTYGCSPRDFRREAQKRHSRSDGGATRVSSRSGGRR